MMCFHKWTPWNVFTAHMDSPLLGWIKGRPVEWTQLMQARKCLKCRKIETKSL
jgi:hypothetical protein